MNSSSLLADQQQQQVVQVYGAGQQHPPAVPQVTEHWCTVACSAPSADPVEDHQARWILSLYILEIITLVARCVSGFCTPAPSPKAWIAFAIVQLTFNVLVCLYALSRWRLIPRNTHWCPPLLAWIGIVIVNVYRAITDSGLQWLQLTINAAWYLVLLRFWGARAEKAEQKKDKITKLSRWLYGVHAVFTLEILACDIALVIGCSSASKASLLETQLELFLVGYIFATCRWV